MIFSSRAKVYIWKARTIVVIVCYTTKDGKSTAVLGNPEMEVPQGIYIIQQHTVQLKVHCVLLNVRYCTIVLGGSALNSTSRLSDWSDHWLARFIAGQPPN